MPSLFRQLKPHTTTGIKRAVFECMQEAPNAGIMYTVFQDRVDCVEEAELVEGVRLAVNILEANSRKVDEYKNGLGSEHCDYKNQTSYELQVYGKGCPHQEACLSLSDIALSILGEVQKQICDCPCETLYIQHAEFDGHLRSREETYSKDFVRLTALLTVTHRFNPCDPYELHTDIKRLSEIETTEGLNIRRVNEPWGGLNNGNNKRSRPRS